MYFFKIFYSFIILAQLAIAYSYHYQSFGCFYKLRILIINLLIYLDGFRILVLIAQIYALTPKSYSFVQFFFTYNLCTGSFFQIKDIIRNFGIINDVIYFKIWRAFTVWI